MKLITCQKMGLICPKSEMKTLQSSGAKPEISLYANFLAWKFHTCRFLHCRKYRSCGIQQCAWRAPPVTWCCCCVVAVCVRGGGSASLLQPPPGGGRELLTGHTSENREGWPPGAREEVEDIPLSADLRPWIRPFSPLLFTWFGIWALPKRGQPRKGNAASKPKSVFPSLSSPSAWFSMGRKRGL